MKNFKQIYSYANKLSNRAYNKTFKAYFIFTYLIKSLFLVLFIPIDFFVFLNSLFKFIKIKKSDKESLFIFQTVKNYGLMSNVKGCYILIGSILNYRYIFKNKCIYIPASFFYPFIFLNYFFKLTPNYFFIQFYIKLFFALFTKNYNKVYFIYHSDALPFSRALIYCGYKFNFINVCIHHGIFSRDLEFSEIDGSLSDILITRSSHDASQVLSVNPNVKTIIEPNFFIIHITPINTLPKYILLIGEGWHRLDKKFAYSYIRKLKNLEKILLVNNFKVKYRPHPSERFNYFIYKFRFKKYDFLNLEQSLSMTHSVIGFSSTLLIDSSAIGINSYNISVYNKFCSDLSLHGQKVNKVISTNNLLKMLSHDASKINKFDKLNSVLSHVIKEIESYEK